MEPSDIISRFRQRAMGYDDAHEHMRQALIAAGAKPRQAVSAMHYAYDRGHSSGQEQVLMVAASLVTIFKGE